MQLKAWLFILKGGKAVGGGNFLRVSSSSNVLVLDCLAPCLVAILRVRSISIGIT